MNTPTDPTDNADTERFDSTAPDPAPTDAGSPGDDSVSDTVPYPLTRSQRDAVTAAQRFVASPAGQGALQAAHKAMMTPNVTRALSEVTRKFTLPVTTLAALDVGRTFRLPQETVRGLDLTRNLTLPAAAIQNTDLGRNLGMSASTMGAIRAMNTPVPPASTLGQATQAMNSLAKLATSPQLTRSAQALADVHASLSRWTLPPTFTAGMTPIAGTTGRLDRILAPVGPILTSNRMFLAQWKAPYDARVFDSLRVFDGLRDTINALMASWKWFDSVGDRLAGLALAAARRVKRAILGDPDHRRIVAEFARRWLGIKRVNAVTIDAVIDALLEGTWEDAPNVIGHLNSRTTHHRASWRFSTERQLGGQSVTSLHRPITAAGATLLDLRPGVDTIAAREEYRDPRLTELLSYFTPAEAAVIETRLDPPYEGPARTWADAAVMCGLRVEDGELIRRRYNYRRTQLTA